MFSLYFDEDSATRSLINALRSAGFDCLTAHEAGRLKQADEEQLVFAATQKRVLYTKNVGDFARLQKDWQSAARSHSGIIVVSKQRAPIGVQIRGLQVLAEQFEPDEMKDRLVYLLNYA